MKRALVGLTCLALVFVVIMIFGAAYGAALLAGVGAGVWPDVDAACDACVKVTGSTEVQPEMVARYNEIYQSYTRLYPALKPFWSE